jgi:hypothetical protein
MTRLLFLPDEDTLLFYESPLCARELVHRLNLGSWDPPEGLGRWLDDHGCRVIDLYALYSGKLIILVVGAPPVNRPRLRVRCWNV